MEKLNFPEYRRRKKKGKFTSLIVGAIGLFIILDSWTVFPIPLYGPVAWYVGGFLLVPSIIAFIYFNQPPSDRMIARFAAKTNGYVLATLLVDAFDISTDSAEDIMKRLFLEGYLNIINKVDDNTPISQWVTVFVGAGDRRTNSHATEQRTPEMDLAAHTAGNDVMTAADINNMLLNGGLNLGGSGQPI